MKNAYLNWSSGKDAAMALYEINQNEGFKIEKLVTTSNNELGRVSMHGLRNELLEKQVRNLKVPLHKINLSSEASLQAYNKTMKKELLKLKAEGFTHSIFGDIFLEDLRDYRQKQLKEVGMEAVFPLWKRDVPLPSRRIPPSRSAKTDTPRTWLSTAVPMPWMEPRQ